LIPSKLIPTPTNNTPPIPAIESDIAWSIDPPIAKAHKVKKPWYIKMEIPE
jgi:hypothetical protein